MTESKGRTGYFLFSIDTELAYGFFDTNPDRGRRLSLDRWRMRQSIKRLLNTLDEFHIVGTWAVVGHMFYERCENCDVCPILDWRGKYQSFEEVYGTSNGLWYGADVIEALLTSGSHEIGFHGYTHAVFDENSMGQEEARIEIAEWLRVSERRGVTPCTVIFPRGKAGHLGLFKEFGFTCFRGPDLIPEKYLSLFKRKGLRRLHYHLSPLLTPAVYDLNVARPFGMVNLPSSRCFFRLNPNLEMILDSLGLGRFRIDRIVRGVRKAADEKKVIHIRVHAEQFQTDRDIEKLRYLLCHVASQVSKGKIQSVGMGKLARMVLDRYREGGDLRG